MKRIYLFTIVISLILTSCFTIKPGVTKTGKNFWEEFFVSEGVMQYFIKPLTFRNRADQLEIDFTFRTKSDSATVNFSIISINPIDSPEKLTISNSSILVKINLLKTLLTENFSKKMIRKSGKISCQDLRQLINDNQWTIVSYSKSETSKFFSPKKTSRKIDLLEKKLIPQAYQE